MEPVEVTIITRSKKHIIRENVKLVKLVKTAESRTSEQSQHFSSVPMPTSERDSVVCSNNDRQKKPLASTKYLSFSNICR